MTKNQEIKIFKDQQDLFQFVANDFMQRAIIAVNKKGIFSVVLSGGNTPKLFFDILANDEQYKKNIPWGKIQFFFGDERYVSFEDVESNYHSAYEHLFSKVPVKVKNIYRIPTEFNHPNDAAAHYEKTLHEAFHNEIPIFDLVYLGLGADAHTASLMPFSDIVSDKNESLVVSLWVPQLKMYRITLTPSAINNSMNIVFLVTGMNKSRAVWEVLAGRTDTSHYPAQLIHCAHGKTNWYLDQAAASKLGRVVN